MKTITTILTLLLLTSISGRIFACSCIGQRTVEEEVKHADAVIIGTILSKKIVTFTDSTILKIYPNDTTMRNSPMGKITIAHYDLLVQDILIPHRNPKNRG